MLQLITFTGDLTPIRLLPNYSSASESFSQAASEGTTNYLRIQAVDAAGNQGAWSDVFFNYWLDTSPPVLLPESQKLLIRSNQAFVHC